MADFNRNTSADMAADRADINTGTTGRLHDFNWGTEDAFWRDSFASRPYARADRGYGFYQPAYRYGAESAHRYHDRDWHAAENDLRSGWDQARGESHGAWEEVKDAVRDAWDRIRGR